jgi:hypothetical protein
MAFKHLKQFDVSAKPREYQLHQISMDGISPTLQLLPATEANKPYHTSLLRRNVKNARRIQAGRVDRAFIEESRQEDRELYAQHVVRGWSGVKDDEGKDVSFSPAECLEFLKALPNWIFDELRAFASQATNFIPEEAPTEDEAEVHSGN